MDDKAADITTKYREFFRESPAGLRFIETLDQMIASEHERAEDNPELSRDHTQRAKGIRDVIGKINTITAGINRGNTAE